MLSTKRVNTYGKRSSRIVHLSSENQPGFDSPIKRNDVDNVVVTSPVSARKLLRWGRKVKGHSTSPRGSPKAGNMFGRVSKKSPLKENTNCTPHRQPLGLKSHSILNSPSVVYLGTRTPHPPKQTTFAPFVDSDVAVTPEKPKKKKPAALPRAKLTEITNVSSTEDEQPLRKPLRRKVKRMIISDSDDEGNTDNEKGSSKETLQVPRGLRHNPILISDEDEESILDDLPEIARPKELAEKSALHNSRSKLQQETQFQARRPPRRTGSLRKQLAEKRISTFEGRGLSSLNNENTKRGSRSCKNLLHSELQYLSPLLAECSQETPRNFKEFIESFPSSDMPELGIDLAFRKIGEASYSEVFAIGDVVLKVIPLRNEATCRPLDDDIDLPCESDCKDVLQEIIVTRELGKICPGFINLLR